MLSCDTASFHSQSIGSLVSKLPSQGLTRKRNLSLKSPRLRADAEGPHLRKLAKSLCLWLTNFPSRQARCSLKDYSQESWDSRLSDFSSEKVSMFCVLESTEPQTFSYSRDGEKMPNGKQLSSVLLTQRRRSTARPLSWNQDHLWVLCLALHQEKKFARTKSELTLCDRFFINML